MKIMILSLKNYTKRLEMLMLKKTEIMYKSEESFPVSKISEVENHLQEITELKIDLNISLQKDFSGQKFETLKSQNLISQMPKFATAMWKSYTIECRFKVFKEKGFVLIVADAKYNVENGGRNTTQIANFKVML